MKRLHALFICLTASTLFGCTTAPKTAQAPLPHVIQSPVRPAMTVLTPQQQELAQLQKLAPTADPGVLALALEARSCAVLNGDVPNSSRLAVIDYSRPSTEKRLWVFDLANNTLLFNEYVAHGQGSGMNYATSFGNTENSHKTSIGLFLTAETYQGGNGYSMRMDGLDRGFNDNARQRAIVMHGADYVNPNMIASQGRIGRSYGCPALRRAVAAKVINIMKDKQLVFSYANDNNWLHSSRFFGCNGQTVAQIMASARDNKHNAGGGAVAVAAP